MQLAVNMLLKCSESNLIERIVWLDDQYCYVVNINEASFPYQLTLEEVIESLQNETKVIVEQDPFVISVEDHELTEAELSKREFAWAIIQSIYVIPAIFDSKLRAQLIKEASEDFGVTKKTVRQYLKRYWARGMTKNSLLPDYMNCGKTISQEKSFTKKPGRPTIYDSAIKRAPVTEEWKKIFRGALEKHYFIKSKPSLKYAYQQMLKESFSKKDFQSGVKVLDLDNAIPTFDQFYYWYRKWYKADYVVRKREGQREYLKNYRAIIGSATEDAKSIGVFAIDATIGDIYLVSTLDKNNVVGRPTIYLIVDIFSRAIVGVSVTLMNMSGESVRVALANCFDNKQAFCKRVLNMDIGEGDWPMHYIPHTILADRGSELISDSLTSLTENLNIKLSNIGPYRPELKGICESYFGILQQHLAPFLPGAVQKDFNKRGGKDYRKLAVLNIQQYTQILVRCIIYYNHRYLEGYPLSKAMIEQNVFPTPIEIFKWGLSRGNGRLIQLSSEQIRSNVLPTGDATVTAKGIRFAGLYYSSKQALKENWFSQARIKGSYKIKIQYDPQDVSVIYLRHDRRNYEVCHLVEYQSMYKNVTLEEVRLLQLNRNQQQADFEHVELNYQIQLAQEIEAIVQQAKAEDDSSLPKDIKAIRHNRKMEKELLINSKYEPNNEPPVFHITPIQKNKLSLFQAKQKEALDDDYQT
ncbi:Mu transposase C-terminal domain-containing protein [Ureibacillus suwonensis]|uniref:Mu transposase C-terminal domain-containing protein n=1 Tax=Ureibacillus suwonensis TaxID=313007 RepID=A0ABW0RBH6_9BACL